MNWHLIIILFYILLVFTGCKKDLKLSLNTPASDCEPWTTNGPVAGTNPTKTRDNSLNKYKTMYDPTNPNYFYYLIDQEPGIGQIEGLLIRVNLTAGEKIRLNSSIIGALQINKSGWLVYKKGDLNLYKIKTNGDSLTKLTFNENALFPTWSLDDNFIFYSG